MYEFTDQWGDHAHEVQSSPPYETNRAVSCAACIVRIEYNMTQWRKVLTERHHLPPNFWDGIPII